MAVDGGPVEGVSTCAEDGVATKLRCCECLTAICPACYVRTPVGLRCQACAAATVPVVVSSGERRTRWLVVAAAVAVVALTLAGAAWAASRGGSTADDAAEGAQPALRKVDTLTVATGDFANGTSWTLVARRDGTICFTLAVGTGREPERCQRPPGNRPFSFIWRPVVAGPGGPAYATVGLVSEQVDRIRVAPQGALGTYEVGTVGADAGLGGRFFVTDSPTNAPVVLTALSAAGNQLGRANVSEARVPPR